MNAQPVPVAFGVTTKLDESTFQALSQLFDGIPGRFKSWSDGPYWWSETDPVKIDEAERICRAASAAYEIECAARWQPHGGVGMSETTKFALKPSAVHALHKALRDEELTRDDAVPGGNFSEPTLYVRDVVDLLAGQEVCHIETPAGVQSICADKCDDDDGWYVALLVSVAGFKGMVSTGALESKDFIGYHSNRPLRTAMHTAQCIVDELNDKVLPWVNIGNA